METSHQTRLTAPEIANLWTQFQNETLAICINTHMLKHMEDKDCQLIFENAISISTEHIKDIENLLRGESFPIPQGFSMKDVNLQAPQLFSDILCLKYLHEMTIHGLSGYAVAMTTSIRQDMREYYEKCNRDGIKVYNQTIDLLLSKGVYHRPPYVPIPEGTEFVQSENFLDGLFGDKRSLNVIEISNIYFNLKKSIITKAITIGFSQTAKAQEVRRFFVRTADIKQKHIAIFSTRLTQESLPAPPSWDSDVTNSTTPPFSDRMMLYHVGFLFGAAVAYYGTGLATSLRSDLVLDYNRTILEDEKLIEDWIDIMIENKWMEQPPKSINRRDLAKI
ncbi:MAG TPA: DUF3231 family protein [Bacillota bacterium]|nr:DUF3231 family protein [Bacillota bacterium]